MKYLNTVFYLVTLSTAQTSNSQKKIISTPINLNRDSSTKLEGSQLPAPTVDNVLIGASENEKRNLVIDLDYMSTFILAKTCKDCTPSDEVI